MLNEQQLEDLCLGWLQEAGWRHAHGPDIAPDSNAPERTDYRQVILRERLLAALARINPQIPASALEQALHALQTLSEPQSVVRNRSSHRLLLNGLPMAVVELKNPANKDDRPRLQMELETVVRGFFGPELFLDYLRHFVLFEQDGDSVVKKIAGYHQFHAVREAVRATVIAAQDVAKAGWAPKLASTCSAMPSTCAMR